MLLNIDALTLFYKIELKKSNTSIDYDTNKYFYLSLLFDCTLNLDCISAQSENTLSKFIIAKCNISIEYWFLDALLLIKRIAVKLLRCKINLPFSKEIFERYTSLVFFNHQCTD